MAIDLQTLFQSDPAAQEMGLKMIGEQRAADKASLEQMLMKMDQEKQMFPHELRAKELGNQTREAQLPGIMESTRAQRLDNDFNEQTLNPRIQQSLAQYKGKMTKEQYDDLVNTGNIFTQAGQMLEDIPGLASHSRAREVLKDKYLPEFDQVPPQALGRVIRYMGQNMSQLQPDFVKKQALEAQKIEGKKSIEEEKADRAKELTAYKETLKQQTNKMKEVSVKDPTKFEAAIVQLRKALSTEKDPDARALIQTELEEFITLKDYFDQIKAAATAAGRIDPNAMGLKTGDKPVPPAVGDKAPSSPTSNSKPATLADVQKMYPGVPADKLKEAYKRKFGVDLQ